MGHEISLRVSLSCGQPDYEVAVFSKDGPICDLGLNPYDQVVIASDIEELDIVLKRIEEILISG